MRQLFFLFVSMVLALPAAAQEPALRLGNDVYDNGRAATVASQGVDDAFLAGGRSTITAPISGTAHMVGRWISVRSAVGGTVYALGQRVAVDAPVAQDVTVIAQQLNVNASVGGDLRFLGSDLTLAAEVKGDALVSSEFALLDAPVKGDLLLTVADAEFGPNASVTGRIIVYESEIGRTAIPDFVAAADQIERRPRADAPKSPDLFGWRAKERAIAQNATPQPTTEKVITYARAKLRVFLIYALMAVLFAALLPRLFEDMYEELEDTPGQSFLWGGIALSGLLGVSVLLVTTLWGAFVAPITLFAGALLAVFGFAIGIAIIGQWVANKTYGEKTGLIHRCLTACLGAAIVTMFAMIPTLGWAIQILVASCGAGALALKIMQPKLFAQS
jgi:hypothetical protein